MGLPTLGVVADLALYGLQGTQTLSFPVPAGLTPAALNATVELPPNVTAGSIAVTQDNRTVSRVDLPPDRAPISIPLEGVEVVDNAVTVLLRSQLLPPAGYCLYDTAIPLRLAGAAVAYTGRELPPDVVADFLPPVLERLTIFVPDTPSRAESDAAVRLTTAVVARYGDQRTDVDVEPLTSDAAEAPSGPFERHIVVREGPTAAVELQGRDGVPALLITGPANELLNQARLLSSNLSQLALASKAVAGPIKSVPQLPGDTTTIRDLGQPGVNATALKPQVTVGLDQTRLGRPVKNVRVHLKGSYTPLPASVGGQIVASVNGQAVDRWPIDAGGAIDRWVDIPDELLQRYTNLGVAVDLSGNTGECGEFQPVTLTIDGATTVETTRADPPVPAGFQSLPQALMPRVLVGVGTGFDDVRRAVTITEGLQRLSALPIDTEVVSVDDALAAQTPAVVIAADGWAGDRPELPVSSAADGELDVDRLDGERTTLRLDPGLRFGSLQTVYDGRTVLVATSNGDAAELDSLLAWLDDSSRRWSRLSGVAVIAPPGGEPVTVAGEAPAADEPAEESTPVATLLLAAGATAAAAIALLGWLVLRRRRRA
ncbi:hypothetical protein BHQ18_08260 [Mycolicibacterium flavescens]|uniref:Uncharacterized protein n=1 Tax=Mycolicibacterium flavescens TaxID=1776 RepID=A0A1E3RM61_MYCFV|nr:hypothetical protein BHQ18_08260 [Mycolicibacterium flavescens]